MYVMSSNVTRKECNSNSTVLQTTYDMKCENGGGVLLWSVAVELKTKSVESFIGVGCSTVTSHSRLEDLQSHHSLAQSVLSLAPALACDTMVNLMEI